MDLVQALVGLSGIDILAILAATVFLLIGAVNAWAFPTPLQSPLNAAKSGADTNASAFARGVRSSHSAGDTHARP